LIHETTYSRRWLVAVAGVCPRCRWPPWPPTRPGRLIKQLSTDVLDTIRADKAIQGATPPS
jgi:hypothetical protein